VGSGNQIGSLFEELRMIRDLAALETALPLAYCLDTCHLLAAGFDVANSAGLEETVLAADRVLGMDLIHLIHANDSKGALGSHIDRHENIGKGRIGEDGFRRILTHPKLRSKPFVLETPVDDDASARADIELLKRLAAPPHNDSCS
jgi:deoxyribonuclease IV